MGPILLFHGSMTLFAGQGSVGGTRKPAQINKPGRRRIRGFHGPEGCITPGQEEKYQQPEKDSIGF
jgi:hypothetical protein